jgi:hypothetical protein
VTESKKQKKRQKPWKGMPCLLSGLHSSELLLLAAGGAVHALFKARAKIACESRRNPTPSIAICPRRCEIKTGIWDPGLKQGGALHPSIKPPLHHKKPAPPFNPHSSINIR